MDFQVSPTLSSIPVVIRAVDDEAIVEPGNCHICTTLEQCVISTSTLICLITAVVSIYSSILAWVDQHRHSVYILVWELYPVVAWRVVVIEEHGPIFRRI